MKNIIKAKKKKKIHKNSLTLCSETQKLCERKICRERERERERERRRTRRWCDSTIKQTSKQASKAKQRRKGFVEFLHTNFAKKKGKRGRKKERDEGFGIFWGVPLSNLQHTSILWSWVFFSIFLFF
jgi:Flp pilus assembly protein TadB